MKVKVKKKDLLILMIVTLIILLIILLVLLSKTSKNKVDEISNTEAQVDYYNEYQQQRASD